jgi:hypothetical protein
MFIKPYHDWAILLAPKYCGLRNAANVLSDCIMSRDAVTPAIKFMMTPVTSV